MTPLTIPSRFDIYLGFGLSLLAWVFLGLFLKEWQPGDTRVSVIVYWSLMAVLALCPIVVAIHNPIQTTEADGSRLKIKQAVIGIPLSSRTIGREDVVKVEMVSELRKGFPVSHWWYGVVIRLWNDSSIKVFESRDCDRAQQVKNRTESCLWGEENELEKKGA